jgi:hypothetical protein
MVDVSALWFSIVASVALTVVLNLVLLLWPGAFRRLHDMLGRIATQSEHEPSDDGALHGPRVFFPWKWMLIASLVLTLVINALIVMRR